MRSIDWQPDICAILPLHRSCITHPPPIPSPCPLHNPVSVVTRKIPIWVRASPSFGENEHNQQQIFPLQCFFILFLTLLGVKGETILMMCSASAEACLKGNDFLFSLSGTAVKSKRRRTAGVLIANPDRFHNMSPNLVDGWENEGGCGGKGVIFYFAACATKDPPQNEFDAASV